MHPQKERRFFITLANRNVARAAETVERWIGSISKMPHYRICLLLASSSPCRNPSGESSKPIGA